MFEKMRDMVIKPEHLYTAGFVSIGLTVAQWGISMAKPKDSREQADRWGLFTGPWAPTFFALGIALRLEEHTAHAETD